MLLKKIKLENIRSFLNQEINFPFGSVLLAGDIGTGKSTILLAIDFALFGLRKDMSGSALLRNGKNNGSVELLFNVDGKDITIKRTLKRSSNSIMQDSGYIIINGVKREGTATELKQKILELLNYPSELLTKSKGLIYRYTVYTPQEEMKYILLTDKDSRLDILRRVFGIDRYKRIKENSRIVINELKIKKKEFSIAIENLDEKIKSKEEREKQLNELQLKINNILPELDKIGKELTGRKNNLKETEEKINILINLKREFEINELELKNKIQEKDKNDKNLIELEKQIKELSKEAIIDMDLRELKKKIVARENEINVMETTLKNVNNKLNEFITKKDNSEQLKKEITKLSLCPVCKQQVTQEHKYNILNFENRKIDEFNEKIKLFSENEREAEKKLRELRQELDILKKQENAIEIKQFKINLLREKQDTKNRLLKEQEELKKSIGIVNTKKLEFSKKIEALKDVEKIYKKFREEIENLQKLQSGIEIKKTTFEHEFKTVQEIYNDLVKEIGDKLKIKEKINYLARLQDWLERYFINLMDTIERKIMFKVHTDFNFLFQKWFDVLVDNELLNIKINDEFTPLIEQNGYDTDYMHLSGGEKTAAALAYRLALNQVINNVVSTIRTKDLIILDEPTDGFSDEQLDRIRLVLEELNIKQVIIVSHDAKIESFVDNVIRLNKKEHISGVI